MAPVTEIADMEIYGWFGLLLLIVSEYCLVRKIEPFFTWFYCFAWWSYILLADNLLLKLRGQSLLTSRWKVFEMPILGFLGFLPFALECWILYHLLRAIPRHMDSQAARIAWWVCLGIVSLLILRGMDHFTVI
jgi:hypothetical protein